MEYISDKFVKLVERNAHQLANNWLQNVKKHPATPTYHAFDEKILHRRAFLVYSQLGKWMSRETTKEQIEKFYVSLGQERRKEGFALSEVLQALIITRRHIWFKVQAEGLFDSALELHSAIELINRVVLFFDRALFYTAVGYEKKD
jgi:hypothetical protein